MSTKNERMRLVVVGIVAAIVISRGSTNADFTFGEATNLGPTVNSSADDSNPCISADGLTLYFSSRRSGGLGAYDLWVTTRETIHDNWGIPVNLGLKFNTSSTDHSPVITRDGLEFYFASSRPGGLSTVEPVEPWVMRRETIGNPWNEPMPLGQSFGGMRRMSISSDGLEMYLNVVDMSGYSGWDICVAKRSTMDDEWGEPVNLGPTVNGPGVDWEYGPVISPDGLVLIFASSRLGGYSTWDNWNFDLWMTRRRTKDDAWGEPINLGPSINTPYSEISASISSDGRMLYFWDRKDEGPWPGGQGGIDIWQAPIIPIVDLNGDGIVDSADMVIIVDNWGTDEPLCDIGPMPWGDGIVDVQDLIVLAEHLFEEVPPIE